MVAHLKYMSNDAISSLRESVADNVERYRSGDFLDLMRDGNWSIELPLDVDLHILSGLDPSGTPAAEANNSRLVWRALPGLTPSLACEEGIWVRLTHVDCLGFARARWLGSAMSNEEIEGSVHRHFFAETVSRRRDDNAVSLLWWNAYIASLASPTSNLEALEVFLQKADIRLNFVQRSMTVNRQVLAAGIIRAMGRRSEICSPEANFRSFMKVLNRMGGGVVFEAMTESDIDIFMDSCADAADLSLQKKTAE